MGSVIGDILPLAIGVALSPVPIIAVILMLFSKNARSTSLTFLIGWFLGVAVVAVIIVLLADPAQQSTGGEASPLAAIVRIVLGLLLLYLAYRDWQKRPKPGEQAEMPKWMSSIDSMTSGKALGLGALLSGVNPKNLALIIAAGVVISGAGLNATQTIIALVVFVVLACVSVAAPVLLYLILGDKAAATLNSWKMWLTQNNTTVMMLLCLVFGIVLLGKGLGVLIGG
ncbi:MAG TPA: GAP family protein [Anaerolineales bacterium]|nr:GAP family protein [Anaerolineales bacterium]